MLDLLNRITALETKLSNLIRYAVIKEVDLNNNQVTADLGNNLTTPKLPYLVNSSGNASVYFAPKVGDQVVVIAPFGNLEQGFIIPSIYKRTVAGTEDEWRLKFAKGEIIYKAGELNINADSKVNISAKEASIKAETSVVMETKEATIKSNSAKIDAASIILADETGGGVVCQNHTCAFTGGPHPIGSTKVKGAK